MKVLCVGGAGKQGRNAAWHLAKNPAVSTVGIADRDEMRLKEVAEWIGGDKIRTHAQDLLDRSATEGLLREYDVALNTLPNRRVSYRVIQMAIETGTNLVDILEEYHRRPDPYEMEGLEIPAGMSVAEFGESLHEQAMEKGVTILDGMGFAPGLTNVTLGEGLRKLDGAEAAVARCGGIPNAECASSHPLSYMITWAFGHVLREYMLMTEVLKDGKRIEVPALTEYERFRFDRLGLDHELECAITPGMPSFMYTRAELKECHEKTVRWPGHYEGIRCLKECGLLETEPLRVGDVKVAPRDVTEAAVTPRMQPCEDERDACVMWNTARGTKDGRPARVEYYMWEEADNEVGISAMSRVTAFPAAISTVMLGRGDIKEKGIVAPEDGIAGPLYAEMLEELNKDGIAIREEVHTD